MVEYSDIQGQLNTQWNVAVIAKPTFYNGDLRNTSKYPNTLFIQILGGKNSQTWSDGLADVFKTDFLIKIIASTRANLEKFAGEVKRILNAKSVNGGVWRVRDFTKPTNTKSRYNQIFYGYEEKYMVSSSYG